MCDRRAILFGIGALVALILALGEAYIQLRLSTYPLSVASVAINLFLAWAALGLYFSFVEGSSKALGKNLQRVVEVLMRLLSWAVLLLALPVLVALTAVAAPDWTIRLLQAAAWPAVVALAALVVFRTPGGAQLIRSVFAQIQRVSVAGVEVDLSETAAKQVNADFQSTFQEYRKQINSEYDRQVRIMGIEEKLASAVQKAMKTTYGDDLTKHPPGYRCTLHVPDALFADHLYQLVEYYPYQGPDIKRGRTLSKRYGMIGRTWRFKDTEPPYQQEGNVFEGQKNVFVDKWAMTPGEAEYAAKQGYTALVSVLLKEEKSNVAVGILYFDSKMANAFGRDTKPDDFAMAALHQAKECELTTSIAEIGRSMLKVGPSIPGL